MRKPFKAGRFTLGDTGSTGPWWWLYNSATHDHWAVSTADLRHIARLCGKALKYRHKGKGAK